ncbi:GGDEF domain-containing protein [Alteromonas sp. 1_MG-2023]|uniref:GGDEF domain-containing protein n=1 Tax=Alteromonas sp. 1_MG-2023 TaxID=3062669 RepID=UPI0026E2FC7F|nr:GGDEF domain-containing protein [Alteromonas sp. 1_MG-2023]MDO6567302.1 GGDEF domain-containing protein [Alteromonas sp. 1_MG-2023]
MLLYYRLTSRHEEQVKYYLIFALAALTSGVFFGAFGVLVNSSDNLFYLSISNRVTVITAMFTIVLSLHFYIAFFQYKAPIFLQYCYVICGAFSLLAIVPNQYFLNHAFYSTSKYYTGLEYGPVFQLWGVWILVLAAYCIFILVRVFNRQRVRQENSNTNTVLLLLVANVVWVITGLCDTFTGIQVVDLPPLSWVGSFLVTSCIAWVLVLHIDDLYEERRLLSNRLMYDYLTQAFSRSYLEIRLTEAVNLMLRGELNWLSVCVFDIDDFKKVNDQYGHANGDELLTKITTITKENIRQSDCIARLGGDEFVILFANKQDENYAPTAVERIRKGISNTDFGKAGCSFNTSCSFGIVSVTSEQLALSNENRVKSAPNAQSTQSAIKVQELANQMLSSADDALYSAKNKGKNAVSIGTFSG